MNDLVALLLSWFMKIPCPGTNIAGLLLQFLAKLFVKISFFLKKGLIYFLSFGRLLREPYSCGIMNICLIWSPKTVKWSCQSYTQLWRGMHVCTGTNRFSTLRWMWEKCSSTWMRDCSWLARATSKRTKRSEPRRRSVEGSHGSNWSGMLTLRSNPLTRPILQPLRESPPWHDMGPNILHPTFPCFLAS